MKMRNKIVILYIAMFNWCYFAAAQEYPVMRPDRETELQWIREYEQAPKSFIDPKIDTSSKGYVSLLNHITYVTSNRNQGLCGNCWVWAGTGCLEIALHVETNVLDRLSIQYFNSCDTSSFACCGGWLYSFASFYESTQKAIPWDNANAEFQDSSKRCSAGSSDVTCASIVKIPYYTISSINSETITTHTVGQITAINNIKNVLNQDKAVWFAVFWSNDADLDVFYNFWNNNGETVVIDFDYICNKTYISNERSGHAILCVGYNDDNPGNRYWIMLNSWGTANGLRPHGLFRMNMDVDYDCSDNSGNKNLYWQSLDVDFGTATSTPTPAITHTRTPTPTNTPLPGQYCCPCGS